VGYLDGLEKVVASHLRHAVVSEHHVNGQFLRNNSESFPISELLQLCACIPFTNTIYDHIYRFTIRLGKVLESARLTLASAAEESVFPWPLGPSSSIAFLPLSTAVTEGMKFEPLSNVGAKKTNNSGT
jgi:hypothetical protein